MIRQERAEKLSSELEKCRAKLGKVRKENQVAHQVARDLKTADTVRTPMPDTDMQMRLDELARQLASERAKRESERAAAEAARVSAAVAAQRELGHVRAKMESSLAMERARTREWKEKYDALALELSLNKDELLKLRRELVRTRGEAKRQDNARRLTELEGSVAAQERQHEQQDQATEDAYLRQQELDQARRLEEARAKMQLRSAQMELRHKELEYEEMARKLQARARKTERGRGGGGAGRERERDRERHTHTRR